MAWLTMLVERQAANVALHNIAGVLRVCNRDTKRPVHATASSTSTLTHLLPHVMLCMQEELQTRYAEVLTSSTLSDPRTTSVGAAGGLAGAPLEPGCRTAAVAACVAAGAVGAGAAARGLPGVAGCGGGKGGMASAAGLTASGSSDTSTAAGTGVAFHTGVEDAVGDAAAGASSAW